MSNHAPHATKKPDNGTTPPIRLEIPASQKTQLKQAVVTLLTILVGIVLTLGTQVVDQVVFPAPVEAPAATVEPAQALGTSHFSAIDVGGGYGSTGCSLSAAGVLQCDGAATIGGTTTTTGALTAASAAIGGGYGSTGCSLSAAGVLQCDGAATIGGAASVAGAATFTGNIDANGDLALAGLLRPECATSALTGTQTLTPTASCYLLSGTSTLTLTLGTVTTGTLTTLVRTGNADLVLPSAIKTSDSDLNQYDGTVLVYDGSEWVQIGVSAN
jgi:hypothetical protein